MHLWLDRALRASFSTQAAVRSRGFTFYGVPLIGLVCLCALLFAAYSSSPIAASSGPAAATGSFQVVATENFWGSIAKQEAGSRARVTSIIVNPNADPHAYEPSTADARLVASARYVIFNGVGYDSWAQKLLNANPVKGRLVLDAGTLAGKKEGDNPHLWYSPAYVTRVADKITADYQRIDPRDAAYFGRQHAHFLNVALAQYRHEISLIATRYHGVPVGATESIFQYLAQPLRLNLITPYGFMKAIAEGTEPTAQDKATVNQQVTGKKIKVLIYNSQNSTPDVQAVVAKAKTAHIPIVPIIETLQPATASFQDWQTAQLVALQHALARATGR